jgi:uncharacterized membrane protein
MTPFSLLFTLAAIGVAETVYLIRKREASEQPFCPVGDSCHVVLTSPYNTIFYIPNDVLGLMLYVVVSVITAFLVIGVAPQLLWGSLLTVLVAAASLVSALFTYLQWRVIRAWCFWCLMSAATIWLMGFIILSSAAV